MISGAMRFVLAATVAASLAGAPAAQARDWHGRGDYHRGGGGGSVATGAIIGGLIGLGLGAAVASGGYGAPPPAYYGPPRGYYAPPPPAVYYGY